MALKLATQHVVEVSYTPSDEIDSVLAEAEAFRLALNEASAHTEHTAAGRVQAMIGTIERGRSVNMTDKLKDGMTNGTVSSTTEVAELRRNHDRLQLEKVEMTTTIEKALESCTNHLKENQMLAEEVKRHQALVAELRAKNERLSCDLAAAQVFSIGVAETCHSPSMPAAVSEQFAHHNRGRCLCSSTCRWSGRLISREMWIRSGSSRLAAHLGHRHL